MTAALATEVDPRDQLVEHLRPLRAFAISLTRNVTAADDLVQETILKAWASIDKFQRGSNLQAWLFTILRNTYYSSLRKSRREVADPDGVHAATLSVKPEHDGRMAFTDFLRAFDALSDEHREVLDSGRGFGVFNRRSRRDDRRCGRHGQKPGVARAQAVGATSGIGGR